MAAILKRREIPLTIMLIGTFFISVEYYISNAFASDVSLIIQNWGVILMGWAMGFGIISAFQVHSRSVRKREFPEMIYSLIFMAAAIVTVVVGLVLGTSGDVYQAIYGNIAVATGTTAPMLSGLFWFSACYRTFRVRNKIVTILMIFCLVILISNMPFGEVVFPGITAFADWLNLYIRGFTYPIGGMMALYLTMRVLTGREKAMEAM